MKKLLIGAVAVIALLVAAYLASPYYALHNFVSIAKSGDVDQIDAAVDFPRVRESLKAQFNASLVAHMQSDPAMRDNPFSGLGMLMAPAIVDRLVDSVVTADGIAAMVRAGKMEQGKAQSVPPNPDVTFSSSYVTLDRFKTTIGDRTKQGEPIAMMFERQGLFGWRLVRVEVPIPSQDLSSTTPSAASPETESPVEAASARAEAPVDMTNNTDAMEPAEQTPTAVSHPRLPQFDTAAYCAKIGDTAGGSNSIERGCREQEAMAMNELEAMTIPARAMNYCGHIGAIGGGSYSIFKGCVEQETDAPGR